MDSRKCMCCNLPKASLKKKKSGLIDVDLFVCKECFELKREPRWAIVMKAQSYGVDSVKRYLKNRLYCGKEIVASELIN